MTLAAAGQQVYSYLFQGLRIERPNKVWCNDFYIRYDSSRSYVLGGSDGLVQSTHSSLEVIKQHGRRFLHRSIGRNIGPQHLEIMNTDQGSQFTSREFTNRLKEHGVAISMDGKGQAIEHEMIERLWRTVKYEDIYLKNYTSGADLNKGQFQILHFGSAAKLAGPPNTR